MLVFEAMLADLSDRYPHLVMSVSGPWRENDGKPCAEPWIVNFKNASLNYQEVHSGSSGASVVLALQAGVEWLDNNRDQPRVQDSNTNSSEEALSPTP